MTLLGNFSLDKGVAQALNKSGHGGQSASTIEKSASAFEAIWDWISDQVLTDIESRPPTVSDGIRTAFRKLTGKDVPVKDQQYS